EHPLPVTTLAFDPRGHRLATGCRDHKARVFAIPTAMSEPLYSPVRHYQGFDFYPDSAWPIVPAFVDEGRGLLMVPVDPQGQARQVNWLNAENGALERTFRLTEGHRGIYSLAVSSDGRTIAIGSADGAQIWEVARGERAASPFLRVRDRVNSL